MPNLLSSLKKGAAALASAYKDRQNAAKRLEKARTKTEKERAKVELKRKEIALQRQLTAARIILKQEQESLAREKRAAGQSSFSERFRKGYKDLQNRLYGPPKKRATKKRKTKGKGV